MGQDHDPAPLQDDQAAAFLYRHGIAPLIGWIDMRRGRGSPSVQPDTQRAVAVEMVRAREFARVIAGCESRMREPPLVYKGQALAHTLYPRPWLRPRGDVDVLVDESLLAEITGVLESLGYRAANTAGGDLVSPQATWRKSCGGIVQAWDVHWGISNRPALSGILTYRDLVRGAAPVRAGDTTFLAPGPVDSLLIACLHLVGHHANDVRLIWLYDIHLMLESMPQASRDEFLHAATAGDAVRAACRDALVLTAMYLPAARTLEMCRALGSEGAAPASLSRTRLARLKDDVHALPGRRLRFLRQHLFPPFGYMMRRFGLRHRWQVPLWYAVRIARAIPKLFRRS